jgi:hypothetical protein
MRSRCVRMDCGDAIPRNRIPAGSIDNDGRLSPSGRHTLFISTRAGSLSEAVPILHSDRKDEPDPRTAEPFPEPGPPPIPKHHPQPEPQPSPDPPPTNPIPPTPPGTKRNAHIFVTRIAVVGLHSFPKRVSEWRTRARAASEVRTHPFVCFVSPSPRAGPGYSTRYRSRRLRSA